MRNLPGGPRRLEPATPRIASAVWLAFMAAIAALALAPAAGARDRLGFNEDIVPDFADWAVAQKKAGANSTRLTMSWQRVEPVEDTIEPVIWEQHLNAYAELRKNGIRPVYTLAFAPDWAREDPDAVACGNLASCAYPPGPSFDGEWAEFVRGVALTFPEADFEIWNEPNGIFWTGGPDPKRYAQLVTIAYQQIKSVSPGSKVILCGCSSPIVNTAHDMRFDIFLDQAHFYWPQLNGSYDAMSYHLYPQGGGDDPRKGRRAYLGPDSYFGQMLGRAQAVMARHGAAKKPLRITELGYWTKPYQAFPLTEKQQARAYKETIDRAHDSPALGGIYFHRGFDQTKVSVFSRQRSLGVFRGDRTPKPVFCSLVRLNVNRYRGCRNNYEIRLAGMNLWRKQTRVRWSSNVNQAGYLCRLPKAKWRRCESSRTVPAGARAIQVKGRSIYGTLSRNFTLRVPNPIKQKPARRTRNPVGRFILADGPHHCRVDDRPFRPCKGTVRFKGLAPGKHRFKVGPFAYRWRSASFAREPRRRSRSRPGARSAPRPERSRASPGPRSRAGRRA